MNSGAQDIWARGAAYERYVGRWSRLVADRFLDRAAVGAGSAWLDVGCGTGVLCERIVARCAPRRVVGVDSSGNFVAYAADHIADDRVRFYSADALDLPVRDAEFDAAVSGLVLNFLPDPPKAIAEMRRAVRLGGTVAVYVWDYAGEMQLIRRFWDAAIALDPAARSLDEGVRFPVCSPQALSALFKNAGLREVAVEGLDVPTVFAGFEDLWEPFMGGQGPAPAYCMTLGAAARSAVRERLRASLSPDRDGSIRLIARAWCARGVV